MLCKNSVGVSAAKVVSQHTLVMPYCIARLNHAYTWQKYVICGDVLVLRNEDVLKWEYSWTLC